MFIDDGRSLMATLHSFVERIASEGYGARAVNNAFRAVHSLKSEAAFLEFEDVTEIAHRLENELAFIRESGLDPGEMPEEATQQRLADAVYELERVVLSRIDQLSGDQTGSPESSSASGQALELVEAGVHPVGTTPRRLFDLGEHEKLLVRDARRQGDRIYELILRLSEQEALTYARFYLLINNLESIVSVVRTVPHPEELNRSHFREFRALISASVGEQEIREALDVDQVRALDLLPLDYDELLDAAAEGHSSGPGMLLGRSGVTLSLSPRNHELLSLYSFEMLSQLEAAFERLDPSSEETRGLRRELKATRRLAERVNSALMTTSLVNLSRVLDPLFRFVENASADLGKQVRLSVSGEREQVFLPVAEVISDALLHLIRNSIDHGIEPPEERIAADKPETAVISIKATRREGTLSIVVSDDGRGVNEEQVRKEVEPDQGEPRSLLSLVTDPGVSTKSETDEVSGRGVGLDAVRHAVETLLGGTLELENAPGVGMAITMRLPEGARLLTVLVFAAGEKHIAVPSCQVVDTFPLVADAVRQDSGGDIYYRTENDVARVFSVSRTGSAVERHEGYGILLSIEGRKGVILADNLISEEVVVRRSDDRNRVYSKTCNDLVSLFIPVSI